MPEGQGLLAEVLDLGLPSAQDDQDRCGVGPGRLGHNLQQQGDSLIRLEGAGVEHHLGAVGRPRLSEGRDHGGVGLGLERDVEHRLDRSGRYRFHPVGDQREVGDHRVRPANHPVFEGSGHPGQRMALPQAVVAQDVRPVVPHVVDVRHLSQTGEGRPEQAGLFVGVDHVIGPPASAPPPAGIGGSRPRSRRAFGATGPRGPTGRRARPL